MLYLGLQTCSFPVLVLLIPIGASLFLACGSILLLGVGVAASVESLALAIDSPLGTMPDKVSSTDSAGPSPLTAGPKAVPSATVAARRVHHHSGLRLWSHHLGVGFVLLWLDMRRGSEIAQEPRKIREPRFRVRWSRRWGEGERKVDVVWGSPG